MRIGRPRHLARRFFETLRARRPSPAEQRFVAEHLDGRALGLFSSQQPVDQAHAVGVAHRVAALAPERTDLVRAALLHDVGKRRARIGVWGRTMATVLATLHLPVGNRMRDYLDHGKIGADLLSAAGESGIVTAFAAGHHGPVPEGIDAADWGILRSADGE